MTPSSRAVPMPSSGDRRGVNTPTGRGSGTPDLPVRRGNTQTMAPTTLRRPSATGSEFAELNRRVNALGLMRRRPAYYLLRLVLVGLLVSGGWAAFFVVGSSWWTLAVAVLLAVAFAQLALVAHDLAHRQ